MINLTLQEIFNIPQLRYALYIPEYEFFVPKLKDRQRMYNETFDSLFEMSEIIDRKYVFYFENSKIYMGDSDSYMTAVQTDITKRIYLKYENAINKEELLLFLGSISANYLKWANEVEQGIHVGRDEYDYSNGEIIVFNGNEIETNNHDFSLTEEKAKLAEAVLITNGILQSNKRIANRPFIISGTYCKGEKIWKKLNLKVY